MLRSSELIIRFVKLGCEGQQACAPSQKFDQVVHGSALELSGLRIPRTLSVSAEHLISSSHRRTERFGAEVHPLRKGALPLPDCVDTQARSQVVRGQTSEHLRHLATCLPRCGDKLGE